jgi:hypothetical protein
MRPALTFALLLASPLAAQQPAAPAPTPQSSFSADSAAVMQVVTDLFQGMRKRDTTVMRAQFHSSAEMRSAGNTRAGMVIAADQVGDWIHAVAGAPDTLLLDERTSAPVVRVDGNYATVWTPYEFWLGPTFSHCGADLFSFARTSGGWKIVFVADSRRRSGCPSAAPNAAAPPFTAPPRAVDSAHAVAAVLQLLDGMRTRDTAQMRSRLEGSVPMYAVAQRADGPALGIDSGSAWVVGVAGSGSAPVLDERIGPTAVEIDGNLAHVSAYYEFRRGDRFSHCGMDQFVLGRTARGWKVIGVGYSVRRDGCTPSLTLDRRQIALREIIAAERAFARYADSASAAPAFLWALREDAITLDSNGVKLMRPIYAARHRNRALLSWAPSYVDVAADGAMGVTSGPWEWRPARDSAVQARGQFLTIWRKGPERWQVALDLGIGGDSTADLTEPVTMMPAGTTGGARLGDLTDLERGRLKGDGWVEALRTLSAPDVRVLRENSVRGSGPAAIDGVASVRFQSLGGTVATSGDLGATWGTWKDGAKKGSYLRIWKRTAEGWQVVVDRMGG